MTKFRPCIDLHGGQVKQIVGGTLSSNSEDLKTNHVSSLPASHFAQLYREHNLLGGHVIMLGPGNEDAARKALRVWPGVFQIGGGITSSNAKKWIEAGAEKVIVTSYLFPEALFSIQRVKEIFSILDCDRRKLVIDLSCRRQEDHWVVATNKWQTLTNVCLNADFIRGLEPYCSEFLVHAADMEGLQAGIDTDLIINLAHWCSIPVTYAGGGRNLSALEQVNKLSHGKVDLTIGSALDIFGGKEVTLAECIDFNERH